MNDIFDLTTRPDPDLFTKNFDTSETFLADVVLTGKDDYETSDIVILGFQNDEKDKSNFDANAVRQEFYNLTNFAINRKIFDLGNLRLQENSVEKIEDFSQVIEKVLRNGKRLIVIGSKGDISFPCGNVMANVFGQDRWLAINVDSHLDVCLTNRERNEPSFRRLLEEKIIVPRYFYEIGFQPYFCSAALYRYLQNQGVKMVSLEQLRSRETADLELRELIRQEFIQHSRSMSILFNFSLNSVRASDAPGVTSSSPLGLRAGEFLTLVQYAAKLVNTKIIQFTELDSSSDIENRTAKLIAIAMHRFCSTIAES
ncbi:formimidoylglutamase [soil metagenome]